MKKIASLGATFAYALQVKSIAKYHVQHREKFEKESDYEDWVDVLDWINRIVNELEIAILEEKKHD